MNGYVLNENTVYKGGLLAEHGLSLLLEAEEGRFLFDMGQSDVFIRNAKAMGKDLNGLDGIILSHGHYDHTGGMLPFLAEYDLPPVYAGTGAFENKLGLDRNGRPTRYIGISWKRELLKDRLVFTEGLYQLKANWYVLSKIPYKTAFEKTSDTLWIETDGVLKQDVMQDEQILIRRAVSGLQVFLGCSHAGIINAVRFVKETFPGEEIAALFAGMHLNGKSECYIDHVCEELEKEHIGKIYPVHCIGQAAIGRMKQYFGDRVCLVQTGMKIGFDD